jgi:hypothetical protein
MEKQIEKIYEKFDSQRKKEDAMVSDAQDLKELE